MKKLNFIFDKTKKAKALKKKILDNYKNYSIKKSEIIVIGGGDGFMLKTIKKFYKLNSMITIIIYEHDNDDKITKYISSISDARVIWGGNLTINKIKSYLTPPHSFDIPFSDRYSFAIINTEHIIDIGFDIFDR